MTCTVLAQRVQGGERLVRVPVSDLLFVVLLCFAFQIIGQVLFDVEHEQSAAVRIHGILKYLVCQNEAGTQKYAVLRFPWVGEYAPIEFSAASHHMAPNGPDLQFST